MRRAVLRARALTGAPLIWYCPHLTPVLCASYTGPLTCLQAHYTEILMRDMAGVPFPAERIFSQTVSGRPKGEVLRDLAARHPGASRQVFVEDKLSTLEKVDK